MKSVNRKIILSAVCAAVAGIVSLPVNADNWLMLQGTESGAAAPRAKVWGFLQPTYMSTDGTKLPAGGWSGQDAQFNVHQPDLSSSSTFQLQRARVGIRGVGFPLDPKINYFLLAEYGNNGITNPGGGSGSVRITDASVTLNHIKGMRVRVGQMKIPMSEEVYQGIFAFNYINFTNIANQQLIERPFQTDGIASCNLSTSSSQYLRYCNGDADTQFRTGAVAVRDIGVMLFDTFYVKDWEHSYALMYGNGGISKHDRDDNKDTTIYWASEKVYGAGRARRQGWKMFAWNTSGKRTVYDSVVLNAGGSYEASERVYDRRLTGLGTTFRKGPYRFWAEYTQAKGMIFNGSTGGAVPGAVNNAGTAVSQFQLSTKGESDGWYLDFGYNITPKLELDIRYDVYNRVTNLAAAAERTYETTTLGFQYFFNKKTRFTFNYEFRTLEAPGQSASSTANQIGEVMDDRISAQIFAGF